MEVEKNTVTGTEVRGAVGLLIPEADKFNRLVPT